MDYEKEHKAAPERAIKAADNGFVSQNFVDDIFAAESEDERIRKVFIQLVQDAWGGRPTAAVSDKRVYDACISLLEKQKEQKPNLLPGFEGLSPDEEMSHPLFLKGFDVGRKVGHVEAEQQPTTESVLIKAGLKPYKDCAMSKRAEEAALKAWPITMVTIEDSYGNPVPYDGASVNRDIYREGYEQAENDLIEKAVEWLDNHISDYECEPMGEYPRLAMLDDFSKAMSS